MRLQKLSLVLFICCLIGVLSCNKVKIRAIENLTGSYDSYGECIIWDSLAEEYIDVAITKTILIEEVEDNINGLVIDGATLFRDKRTDLVFGDGTALITLQFNAEMDSILFYDQNDLDACLYVGVRAD